jgi:hypothetical protein
MQGLYFVYFYNTYCYVFLMFYIYIFFVDYFPCSPVHKICLLFTELNYEDKHIFRDGELRKQSANFKQTQRKQILYFHVNRYIIWIFAMFF